MRIPAAVSLFLFAGAVSGANIRFDPPNPTSRTPVMAHVLGTILIGCSTPSAKATRYGSVISVTLEQSACIPQGVDIVLTGFDLPVDLGVLPSGVYEVVASGNPLVAEGRLAVQDA